MILEGIILLLVCAAPGIAYAAMIYFRLRWLIPQLTLEFGAEVIEHISDVASTAHVLDMFTWVEQHDAVNGLVGHLTERGVCKGDAHELAGLISKYPHSWIWRTKTIDSFAHL